MGLVGLEAEIVRAVERASPSVVGVSTLPTSGSSQPSASGSGLVVGDGRRVVTNDHVVRGRDRAMVRWPDGTEVEARLLGEDPPTDLALLELRRRGPPPAVWADSRALRVGQFAIALGNALGLPGGLTVSMGVVSALGRSLPGTEFLTEGFVQTDAAINPGNSGGPLVNSAGEVVGITTAVAAFAEGVGFAIPSNRAREFAEQVGRTGRVSRPWLGIVAAQRPSGRGRGAGEPVVPGVFVARVVPGGPAALAGLRAGDTITRVGGVGVDGLRRLLAAVADVPIGGAVDLEFARDAARWRTVLRVVEPTAAR